MKRILLTLALALSAQVDAPAGEIDAILKTVEQDSIEVAIRYLSSPALEGRDSPSRGLELASRYVVERFQAAGLVPVADSVAAWTRIVDTPAPKWAEDETGVWLRPYWGKNGNRDEFSRPDETACSLDLVLEDSEQSFELGVDYVPIGGCPGDIRGDLVFAGFGINSRKDHYNDIKGVRLAGKIVVIFDGEPRHKKRFEGAEFSQEASLWRKLKTLGDERVGGVIVIRRPAADADLKKDSSGEDSPVFPFRYTRAYWQGEMVDRMPASLPPALEISPACADIILDTDSLALAAKIDKRARPVKVKLKGRKLSMSSATKEERLTLNNVLAWIPGGDLADEVVVVGAHYDHIGIGARGRIGHGADDNASGTAALCEIAEALAGRKARRSILLVAFSAEEDGLVGSDRLCQDLPVPADKIVAMLNLDMIGRGETDEVVVLGVDQNPDLKKTLKAAKKLARSGIKKVRECNDRSLFARSDHYSFHKLGIPTVFLFENYPLTENKDYHTWRDIADLVDMEKVLNTTRFALSITWILANDDKRLPSPQG